MNLKTKLKTNQSKGQIPLPLIAVLGIGLVAVMAAISIADNANGAYNWFYDDVSSKTEKAEGCDPQKYIVRMQGEIVAINDFIADGFDMRYEVNLLDSQISDISIDKSLGFFSDDIEAKICLYDFIGTNNWEKIECKTYDETIHKGQTEKLPFEFTYNLYDNDCNGEIDDHTLVLVTELWGPDGYQKQEKSVGIIGGETVYQNAQI